MLSSNFSEVFLYIVLYSIMGWICEVIYCSIPAKHFINRGFLHGPYCPIYGTGAFVVITIAYPIIKYPLLVFIMSMCAASTLEYFTSWLMEFLFQVRWWDYSERKFNIKGRVCLKNSLLFGILGLSVTYLVHPLADDLMRYIPKDMQRVLASVIMTAVLVDLLYTMNALLKLTERIKTLQNYLTEIEGYNKEYAWLDKNDLTGSIARLQEICSKDTGNVSLSAVLARLESMMEKGQWRFRLIKSFPHMRPKGFDAVVDDLRSSWERRKEQIEKQMGERKDTLLQRVENAENRLKDRTVTATEKMAESTGAKLGYFKLFWVFATASVLGYIVETIFCLVTRGVIESRQGLLYGPFSQVYGLGAVLMVILLMPLSKKSDRWLFCGSALVGGVFEYICSWVQETIFGTVSWEYSEHAFSIGGRTTITYMFFWGVLGLIFIKGIYPKLSSIITRISKRQSAFSFWILSTVLIVDIFLSGTAVYRWTERQQGVEPINAYEVFLDERYSNEIMEEIYPNMTIVDKRIEK